MKLVLKNDRGVIQPHLEAERGEILEDIHEAKTSRALLVVIMLLNVIGIVLLSGFILWVANKFSGKPPTATTSTSTTLRVQSEGG